MVYIFLDESGDLGFNFKKEKTSRYFVITCLFTQDKKPIEKIVKKIFRGFSKMEVKSHGGILHAFKEKQATRNRVLRNLCEKDISLLAIYLNKSKVYTRLQDEKHVLYNYVVNILLDRIYSKKLIPITGKISLIASRRETNKFLNENFCLYLKNQLNQKHKLEIEVLIRSPQQEKALQIVDFVSWAIFREFEREDKSYVNLIRSKIVEKSPLFP